MSTSVCTSIRGFGTVETVADLEALNTIPLPDGTGVHVLGYYAAGDGGGKRVVFDSGSTDDADGGSVHDTPSSYGRWIAAFDGTVNVMQFGAKGDGSFDDSDAFNAAFAYVAAQGGGLVKGGLGKTHRLASGVLADGSDITFDGNGSTIVQDYDDGPQFVLGNGTTRSDRIKFINCVITTDGTGGPEHPVFETRYVRSFFTEQCVATKIYELIYLGRASDDAASGSYQWWSKECEWGMRTAATGDHSHAVTIKNFSGGLYWYANFFEADITSANSPHGIHIHSNTNTRVDAIQITGGNIKGFNRAVSINNARVGNVQTDLSARFDDSQQWAWYVYSDVAAETAGVGGLDISGTCGGSNQGGGIYIELATSGAGGGTIRLHDLSFVLNKGPLIQIVAAGTGVIWETYIRAIFATEMRPEDETTDAIILDAGSTNNLRSVTVHGLSINSFASSNQPRNLVYTDIATTSNVVVNEESINGLNYSGAKLFNATSGLTLYFQNFKFQLRNNGGTVEHRITAPFTDSAGNYADRINGASATWTTTPTGADASTAFAAGCKVSSDDDSQIIFDTEDCTRLERLKGEVSIVYQSGTQAVVAEFVYTNVDVNGVTRVRPGIRFTTYPGAVARSINTTNLGSGHIWKALIRADIF